MNNRQEYFSVQNTDPPQDLVDHDENTPKDAKSHLNKNELTSFSRKKSFEVHDDLQEGLIAEDEKLQIEKQISTKPWQKQEAAKSNMA